jgi:DNA repair protein RadD
MSTMQARRSSLILPRWYQEDAKREFYQYFHENKEGNPIIALPTGAGKSYVIADLITYAFELWTDYPHKILVCAHVKELLDQNYSELLRVWPDAPAGIYSAGLKRREYWPQIVFASIQSVHDNAELFKRVDLLFIDECHMVADNDASMYQKFIAELKKVNPHLRIIGLSATPFRMGLGKLTNGPTFDKVIFDICSVVGFKRLFADGHLVPPRPVRTKSQYDMGGAKIVAGDFSKHDLQLIGAEQKVTWAAIQESMKHSADRSSRLVFCCDIAHAELADKMLKTLGVNSAFVHSKMPEKDRDDIIAAWKAGEIDTLTNNGICTTGVNHPPLDHIIMLRPTSSVVLWIQMIGRGTRPFDGKVDCLVTDHAGNTRRLGTIDEPHIPKIKGDKIGNAPVRICDDCGTYCAAAASACPHCGNIFTSANLNKPPGYQKEAYKDELVKSDLMIVQDFEVDNVYITRHVKKNAGPDDKPCIKAIYRCGFNTFEEYITIEATGYMRKKAVEWWKARYPGATGAPETVYEALQYISRLSQPKRIKVHTNTKYPRIVGVFY